MKRIQFDKLVTLVIDEEKSLVIINGLKLILEDGSLFEDYNLSVKEAKEIEAKYEKNEEGQYNLEDIDAIQEEVRAIEAEKKSPVELFIGEENVLVHINKLKGLKSL